MNKPIDLFKKSFLSSFLIIALFPLLLKIFPLLFTIYTGENQNSNNTFSLLLDTLNSILLIGASALIVPWILLSFYGEFFYTRSLNRKDVFKSLKNQHFKYLGVIFLLSLLVSYINNTYYFFRMQNDTLVFNCLWVTYISFIVAGNSKLLKKILIYGVPVFVVISFVLSKSINLGFIDLPIYQIIIFIYLCLVYKIVASYNDDIDLNVPGKSDDEIKSFANSFIFSKEFITKPVTLDYIKSFPAFRMLTSYTANIYIQLFLLFISIYFILGLESAYNRDYFTFKEISIAFILIIVFLNPKFISLQGEEFLYTRALNKSKIYLQNYLYQGLFIVAVSLITFILPNFSLLSDFKLANIFLLTLWTFIGGEMSIILLLFLFIFDTTIGSFETINPSYLTTSLITNILSPTINSVILWSSVILFRIFDYLWFKNKEMGFIKEWRYVSVSLLRIYIPSFLICISASLFTMYNNPFTKFLTEMYDKDDFNLYISTDNKGYPKTVVSIDYSETMSRVYDALFFKDKSQDNEYLKYLSNDNEYPRYVLNDRNRYKYLYSRQQSFEEAINNPYDENSILKLSRNFVDEIFNNHKGRGSLGYYKNGEGNLLIYKTEYLLNQLKSLKDTTEYNYQKSVLEKAKGNDDLAMTLAIKSTEDKTNIDYLYNLADLYKLEMKNKEAINIHEKMYLMNDNNNKNLKRIGDIYWNNAEYTKAIDYYARSVVLEDAIFQHRNYRYLGLCNDLKAIESKDYYNKNLKSDLMMYSKLCPQIKFEKKNYNSRYIERTYNQEDITFESVDLDVAKKYVDEGDLEKAEKLLKESIDIRSSRTAGYLALIQIKLKKYQEAEKTTHTYLAYITPIIDRYYPSFHKNNSKYNSDVYKAMLMLRGSYKEYIAKDMVLTATDPDKAFFDLQSMFKNTDLSKIESLKNQYNQIYIDFESKGLSLISGKKSIEKTRLLVKKLSDSEKSKYKDLISYLKNLR